MSFEINRRQATAMGVGAVAALVGAAVAWTQYGNDGLSASARETLWTAKFDTPSGDELHMASFQGRPLVINFWATWCTPCIDEMPLISNFFTQNHVNGWQVVGLAIDQPSRVKQFLSQFPVSYPIGLAGLTGTDLGRQLGNELGGLPFTVVLDAKGRLTHRKMGKLTQTEIKQWAA